MPQPIESQERFGRLRIVERIDRAHYLCSCTRCTTTVTATAKALRLKRDEVNCQRCFPRRPQPRPVIVYNRFGWAQIEEAA